MENKISKAIEALRNEQKFTAAFFEHDIIGRLTKLHSHAKSSVEHFVETGKVTGSFYLFVKQLAKEMSELTPPQEQRQGLSEDEIFDKVCDYVWDLCGKLTNKNDFPDYDIEERAQINETIELLRQLHAPTSEERKRTGNEKTWEELHKDATKVIAELEAELAELKAKQQCNHIWEPVFGMNTIPDYHRCKICLTIK